MPAVPWWGELCQDSPSASLCEGSILAPGADFSFHSTVPGRAVGAKHPQALLRKPCQPVGVGPTRLLGALWHPSRDNGALSLVREHS